MWLGGRHHKQQTGGATRAGSHYAGEIMHMRVGGMIGGGGGELQLGGLSSRWKIPAPACNLAMADSAYLSAHPMAAGSLAGQGSAGGYVLVLEALGAVSSAVLLNTFAEDSMQRAPGTKAAAESQKGFCRSAWDSVCCGTLSA